MQILIVENTPELAMLWKGHLERQGGNVVVCSDTDVAIELMCEIRFDVIVLDLDIGIESGSSIAASDFAQYRQPDASVIFVTGTTFFSDGSIFLINPNARALICPETPPEDLAAMVEHYGAQAALT